MSYTKPSISGYNANPPPDDASETSANTVRWSNHITKIGDPLKSYLDAVNNATESAWNDLASTATVADGAALVGYKHGGSTGTFSTDATDSSVDEKLDAWVDVATDFGLTSAAIQAAFNSGAKHFFFRGTTWTLTAQVNLPSNIECWCFGGAAFNFSGSMAGKAMFKGASISNFRWRGGTFTGDKSADGTDADNLDGCAFALDTCSDFSIEKVTALTFPVSGITIDNCTDYTIRDCDITGVGSISDRGGIAGINVQNASDGGLIENNKIDTIGTNATDKGGFGIRIIEQTAANGDDGVAENLRVVGNRISNIQEHGILWYSGAGSPVGAHARDSECSFNRIYNTGLRTGTADSQEGRGCGIYLQQVDGIAIHGNKIRNSSVNTIQSTIVVGAIAVVGPYTLTAQEEPITINNNTIWDSPFTGISVQAADNITIVGNTIKKVGYSPDASASLAGIRLIGAVNFTCSDNVISEVTTTATEANAGITITSSSTPSRASSHGSVSGNTIIGFDAGILSSASEDVSISGGSLSAFTARGMWFIDGGSRISVSGVTTDVASDTVPPFQTSGTFTDCELHDCIFPKAPSGNACRIVNAGTGFPVDIRGDAQPNTGTWAVGDTVRVIAPTAGNPPGYVCTTAGTAGTWKAMASLAA